MSIVADVEGDNLRRSLGTRPEWLTARVGVIIREESLQVADRVVIVGVEDIAGLLDNSGTICRCLEVDVCVDIAELRAYTSRSSVSSEFGNESIRSLLEELDGILNARAEERVELVTAPFDTVLDLVREVS